MFEPGEEVIWTHTVGGWQWVIHTPAIVVKRASKRIIIDARTKDGRVERRAVKPESLQLTGAAGEEAK